MEWSSIGAEWKHFLWAMLCKTLLSDLCDTESITQSMAHELLPVVLVTVMWQ